jgi:hypothetical protein
MRTLSRKSRGTRPLEGKDGVVGLAGSVAVCGVVMLEIDDDLDRELLLAGTLLYGVSAPRRREYDIIGVLDEESDILRGGSRLPVAP